MMLPTMFLIVLTLIMTILGRCRSQEFVIEEQDLAALVNAGVDGDDSLVDEVKEVDVIVQPQPGLDGQAEDDEFNNEYVVDDEQEEDISQSPLPSVTVTSPVVTSSSIEKTTKHTTLTTAKIPLYTPENGTTINTVKASPSYITSTLPPRDPIPPKPQESNSKSPSWVIALSFILFVVFAVLSLMAIAYYGTKWSDKPVRRMFIREASLIDNV